MNTDIKANNYKLLNSFAEKGGTVLFGEGSDELIPIGELKQAFEINMDCFNRSLASLSLKNAVKLYTQCVKDLEPECVLLHLGENDLAEYHDSQTNFDKSYRELIDCIRNGNPKCRIVILSVANDHASEEIAELNKHLQYFADSERLEFFDISAKKNWNPKATKEVVSFVYSTGFVRSLNTKKPIYDLIKILYSYQNQSCTNS